MARFGGVGGGVWKALQPWPGCTSLSVQQGAPPGSSAALPGLYAKPVCKVLSSPSQTSSTGEEALAAAGRCYDDLSRMLWGLEGLPLTVSAVQGAHPVLRYTEVRYKGSLFRWGTPTSAPFTRYSGFRIPDSREFLLWLRGLRTQLACMRMQVQSLALLSRLRIWRCCGVGQQL